MINKFKIGEIINHSQSKTITEGEAHLFSLLTMNHHPIHIDKEYAKKTKFKKNLVVGTYLISLVAGMTVNDITLNSAAALAYDKIEHIKPVFFGDTITVKSTILNIIKKKKCFILVFKTDAYNQKKIKVLSMKRKNMFFN